MQASGAQLWDSNFGDGSVKRKMMLLKHSTAKHINKSHHTTSLDAPRIQPYIKFSISSRRSWHAQMSDAGEHRVTSSDISRGLS